MADCLRTSRSANAAAKLPRVLCEVVARHGSRRARLLDDQTVFLKIEQHDRWPRASMFGGQMLHIGIELVVNGTPPAEGPMLLVVNHISC
jgi:1-acyl-sn-glycerol-3-phosphate acyltransferase